MDSREGKTVEPEPRLPPGLLSALRSIGSPPFDIPTELDRTIRAMARRHFARRRAVRILRWCAPTAAAAAILLLLMLPDSTSIPPSAVETSPAPIPTARGAEGRVTILDAFALARRLKADEPSPPEWDFNADGTVDTRDVQALAAAAVRLEQGT